MKRLTAVFVLLGLTVSAASAAPSYIQRDGEGGYNVTYDYRDKEKTGWYATARAEISFLNWENKYWSDDVARSGSDDYSFEVVFGGSIAAGKKFGYFWRGEVELGYIGHFKDAGEGVEFTFQTPYGMVNALYDFSNGLYLGGGLGVAVPMTSLDWDGFVAGSRKETSVSPMAGLMVGYTHKLDDNFVLDFRYRLAGYNGTKHTSVYEINGGSSFEFENKIGLVLDNSVSIALRYEF